MARLSRELAPACNLIQARPNHRLWLYAIGAFRDLRCGIWPLSYRMTHAASRYARSPNTVSGTAVRSQYHREHYLNSGR
jgi:hypothetical protein